MTESKAKNMLQKLSLTPKRNHESTEKAPETEDELAYKLKRFQKEKDYLHVWTTAEKLVTIIEERATDKMRKEHAKHVFYLQTAAQAMTKMWRMDSQLPFVQYSTGDISRLYNRAIDVATRHMDPTVVHTLACEAGIALASAGCFMEARDVFIRGEQQLVAVPADSLPDFMERVVVLYGIMDTLLIEERWNEYMVYTDKVWMMTMKEEKRCPMVENICKEVEQIAVLLLHFQKRVECSERHKQLLASYRTDSWDEPITEHNPPLSSLTSDEQELFRDFLYFMSSDDRDVEECFKRLPKMSKVVDNQFRREVFTDNSDIMNVSVQESEEEDPIPVAIYSKTAVKIFELAARNYAPFLYLRR